MIWDTVDDWDDPRSRALTRTTERSDVMIEAMATHTHTYIRRYVDNNKYRYYYVVYRYVCIMFFSTKIFL